jgi:hypothetical protein
MDRFYRMVIDLYKENITNNGVDPERILEVRKAIACAQTEAKILDKPQDGFTELIADLDFLRDSL